MNQKPQELPRSLSRALEKRQLILFLGADIPIALTGVPSRSELEKHLAEDYQVQATGSLPKTAGLMPNRYDLVRFVLDALDITHKQPKEFHKRIVDLVKKNGVKTIITTAYDQLLEKALEQAGVPYQIARKNSDVTLLREDRLTLIKLYGDVGVPDSLVITERDHENLLRGPGEQKLLSEVRRILQQNTLYVLGYDPSDPSLYSLLGQSREDKFAPPVFIVWSGCSDQEKEMWKRDWKVEILAQDCLGIFEVATRQEPEESARELKDLSGERSSKNGRKEKTRSRQELELELEEVHRKLQMLELQAKAYSPSPPPNGLAKDIEFLRNRLIELQAQFSQTQSESQTPPSDREKPTDEVNQSPGQSRPRRRGRVSSTSRQTDVVILTALPEEYQAVCAQAGETHSLPGRRNRPNLYAWKVCSVACDLYQSAYRVAIGTMAGAGNNKSALAIREAVDNLAPRYIFFTGIAGGVFDFRRATQDPDYQPDLQLGDVVISKIIRGYEYGKIGNRYFQPRDNWNYQPDQGLLTNAIAYGQESAWLHRLRIQPPQPRNPKFLLGEIASGDKVVDNPSNAFFAQVLKRWPQSRAIEMEGAGVGAGIQDARDRGRAVGFLMIRGISDLPRPPKFGEKLADWGKQSVSGERDRWKAYASDTAAAFTIGFIAHGLPEPPRSRSLP